jgi:hypothetical protein
MINETIKKTALLLHPNGLFFNFGNYSNLHCGLKFVYCLVARIIKYSNLHYYRNRIAFKKKSLMVFFIQRSLYHLLYLYYKTCTICMLQHVI